MDLHVIATHPVMEATTALHIAGVVLLGAIILLTWFNTRARG